MNKNYQAWDIRYGDFHLLKNEREKLQFLLKFAVLAPSSHNSQPWKFLVRDSEILIFPTLERTLPVSDPDRRLLYFTFGCVIENILIAGDYYGYQTTVEYFPPTTVEAAAKISFAAISRLPENSKENHLIFSIPRRRTNRSTYISQMPEKRFISLCESLKVDTAAIRLVSDSRMQKTIAHILMESRIRAFASKLFRGELARYKRTNLTKSPFGMPGFTMGFNTLFSLVAPFVIRHINVMRFMKNQEEKLLTEHTPIFGFIITEKDTKIDWLKAGRVFERVSLEAEHCNIQTAISAISPQAREQLKEILGIPYFPQVFFRMGYTSKIPGHSPRIPAEDVIVEKG